MANHVLQFELAGCSFRLSRTRLCWYKLGPRTNTLAFDTLFMQHTKGLRFFLSFLLYFRTCKGFEDILNTYPPFDFTVVLMYNKYMYQCVVNQKLN